MPLDPAGPTRSFPILLARRRSSFLSRLADGGVAEHVRTYRSMCCCLEPSCFADPAADDCGAVSIFASPSIQPALHGGPACPLPA